MSADHSQNHPLALIVGTFSLVFAMAIAFVLILTWTLPPSDGAYRSAPFSDPLVFPIMMIGVGIVGSVASLFAIVLLRHAKPIQSAIVVALAMWIAILLTAPVAGSYCLLAGFVAMLASMLYCQKRFPLPQTCGQDSQLAAEN